LEKIKNHTAGKARESYGRSGIILNNRKMQARASKKANIFENTTSSVSLRKEGCAQQQLKNIEPRRN